jgi:hypothetical protein
MTELDFRALCADLVNELHAYKIANPQHDDSLVTRARDALAQPVQVEPTKEVLLASYDEFDLAEAGDDEVLVRGLRGLLDRFSLDRTPIQVNERLQLVADNPPLAPIWYTPQMVIAWQTGWGAAMHFALQAVKPDAEALPPTEG